MGGLTTPAQDRELTQAENAQSTGLLQQIVGLASDPTVDAAKLQTMADLAIKLQVHEQQQQFNRDLNSAIMEMPVISRDGRIVIKDKNTQAIVQSTPFARFEDIDRIVRPIANKHNLSYSFEVGGDATRITVRPIIRHANGFVERGEAMPLPLETSGSKNNVQGAGSSTTYGKRYALCAAFSIVTEGLDTDGHGADQVSLPHEREQLVLQQAEAAHAAGGYQEHFNRQSPRDRAWLVQHGHHARLGGAALPPPKAAPTAGRDAQQAAGSADTYRKAQEADKREQRRNSRTPQQLVDDYVAEVRKCPDRASLEDLRKRARNFRAGIENGPEPQLWTRITDAEEVALDGFGS